MGIDEQEQKLSEKIPVEEPSKLDDELAQKESAGYGSGVFDRLPDKISAAIQEILTGRSGVMVLLIVFIWSGHWDVHGILSSAHGVLVRSIKWLLPDESVSLGEADFWALLVWFFMAVGARRVGAVA